MNLARHFCILAALLASSIFAQPTYDTALKNLKFRSIGPVNYAVVGRKDKSHLLSHNDLAVFDSRSVLDAAYC